MSALFDSVPRLLLLVVLLSAGGPAAAPAQEAFPHDLHEGLFPLCSGCHDVEGGRGALYPSPEQCVRCHDGGELSRVSWSPPAEAPSYRHPDHEAAAGVALSCAYCHDEGGEVHLAALPASCSNCHEPHHSGSVYCRACHAPGVRDVHEASAHRGCAGAGCHATERVESLQFDRQLCLLCHRDMRDHKPDRPCGRCHAVGQPERVGSG